MTKYKKHACDFKNEAECEEEIDGNMENYEGALEEEFKEEI